jgi:hypothetical protein
VPALGGSAKLTPRNAYSKQGVLGLHHSFPNHSSKATTKPTLYTFKSPAVLLKAHNAILRRSPLFAPERYHNALRVNNRHIRSFINLNCI